MARPQVGEVWQVDLGMVAKVRPCLILRDSPKEDELALVLIVPHTTAVRGNRWEFNCSKPFLKKGVFHLQQIQPVSISKLRKRIGELTQEEIRAIRGKLAELLNLHECE